MQHEDLMSNNIQEISTGNGNRMLPVGTTGGITNLSRFIEAQDRQNEGFASALAEIRAGRRSGHWVWYVLPQLAGLGNSEASRYYSIKDLSEARSYLRNPLLRSRLLEVTAAIAEKVRQGITLCAIMALPVDVLKLVSSLTLFRHISCGLSEEDGTAEYRTFIKTAEAVLSAAALEGYPACQFTLGIIQRSYQDHSR